MTINLVALTAAMVVVIAPLWAADSPLRDLRVLPMLAMYPLLPAAWSETQPLEVRLRALAPIESLLRSLTDSFFSLERDEDLTSLIARFVRRHRSRCPALA